MRRAHRQDRPLPSELAGYRLSLQVPRALNGRVGHDCFESTPTSIDCLEVPGTVLSANPERRKLFVVPPGMMTSRRLPASRLLPLSIGWPLYHSWAVPEACPPPEQVRRTETLTSSAEPTGKPTASPIRSRKIVFRTALLKPLLPTLTSLSCPSPALAPIGSRCQLVHAPRVVLIAFPLSFHSVGFASGRLVATPEGGLRSGLTPPRRPRSL